MKPRPAVRGALAKAFVTVCGVLLLLCFKFDNQALAATFSPVQCSPCPAWTSVNWTYNSTAELAPDPNNGASYNNNILHFRYFLASAYVSQVQFELSSFSTEQNSDSLNLVQQGQTTSVNLTGNLSPMPQWVQPATPSMLQAAPLQLRFTSDESGSFPGFYIDQARVCCASQPTTALPTRGMVNGERYTGVLLGANDVVYTWRNAGPAGTRLHLALWGPITGSDFDLYARCNALPTPSAWDLRGYSSDTNEFVFGGTDQCVGGIWYIAVHAYSGVGQFHVVGSDAKVSSDEAVSGVIPSIRVGVNSNVAPSTLSSIQQTMVKALKYLYGATEGKIFFSACQLWNNAGATCSNCGGQPCDVCFVAGVGQSNAPLCSLSSAANITSGSGYWQSHQGVAHELSHRYLCTQDEYVAKDGSKNCDKDGLNECNWHCGHSIMANPFSGQNNFCLKADQTMTVDHPRDGTSGFVPPNTASSWDWILVSSQRVTSIPAYTPDNFDYLGHDFNGAINCAIQ